MRFYVTERTKKSIFASQIRSVITRYRTDIMLKNMKDILTYLTRLRENNNREWFQAHKEEYDRLRPIFIDKVQQLIDRIAQFDDEIAGLEAKSCMYRIYRDIRFSPDKTPYKTYMSAYMAKGGRKSLRAGYYFHLEPGNCMISGGMVPRAETAEGFATGDLRQLRRVSGTHRPPAVHDALSRLGG